MISKINNKKKDIAEKIYLLFQASYKIEAELLKATDFPPLKRTASNLLDCNNIFFGFHGGAEWMGASINNNNGIMYVNSHNIPWIGNIYETKNKFSYYKYLSKFERLFDENGYPGSKPPWGNLTAIDLNSGKLKWQVPFGEYENLTKLGIPLIIIIIDYNNCTSTK